MTIIHHVITILPPEGQRLLWLATCSQGDYSMSFRNSIEARIEGSKHINEVMLQNALERGQYEFDDGAI
jgi:hypothetical protein